MYIYIATYLCDLYVCMYWRMNVSFGFKVRWITTPPPTLGVEKGEEIKNGTSRGVDTGDDELYQSAPLSQEGKQLWSFDPYGVDLDIEKLSLTRFEIKEKSLKIFFSYWNK